MHDFTPEDVQKYLESLQIVRTLGRTLGRNMGWPLQCIQKGKEAGAHPPALKTPRQVTNFIS